ncbi:MAG: aldo/keto reductase [Anaerolineae bacterium]|nr:aldo/keto reductase [Anaerolineae bacterium]
MALSPAAFLAWTDDLTICRILNGMWQVSGAHGAIDREAALAAMQRYHAAGFTTWDLADHYGPAEDWIGLFRQRLAAEQGPAALATMQAFTKWVPRPGPMTRPTVERAIDISLRRMQVEALDLLQFHWWLYRDTAFLDALRHLDDLRRAGKIRYLALTNFDTHHLELIVSGGIPILSNQVQYSLIDRRPETRLTAACVAHGVRLLAYGTLCGGLLSEKYVGVPEPAPAALNTASLRKYKQMIDLWGGWSLFQELLHAAQGIARRHGVTIAAVATRYILDKPAVAGVIAGARLGLADHYTENARVFDFALDENDLAQLHAVTDRGENLFWHIGDCGDEYRR